MPPLARCDQIGAPVRIEIGCQYAGDLRGRRRRLNRHFVEPAEAVVEHRDRRCSIGGEGEVEIAVIVNVEQGDARVRARPGAQRGGVRPGVEGQRQSFPGRRPFIGHGDRRAPLNRES
jgi:hypothetical protein